MEDFIELSVYEQYCINGGEEEGWFEEINPMDLLNFIYDKGKAFGATGVKFGRVCYHFFSNVKTIFSQGER